MKNLLKYSFVAMLASILLGLASCNDYEPKGYTEVASLPKVASVSASCVDRLVTVNWTAPVDSENDSDFLGYLFIPNGEVSKAVEFGPETTSYEVEGQPMGIEYYYSVKARYTDGRLSPGVSATVTVPQEDLAPVQNLQFETKNRTIAFTWELPADVTDITGVRILRDGKVVANIDEVVTAYQLKAQPMEEECEYSVELMYYTYYPSPGVNCAATFPYIKSKIGYLLLANSVAELTDDDEIAAAQWFEKQPDAEFVKVEDLANLDSDIYSVLWVEIDQAGLPLGWQNLPVISEAANIAALQKFSAEGGNLFLSNMATQLTVPLGIVPSNMAPTVYGNGAGGKGTDVWTMNPFLGYNYKDGGAEGYYDRSQAAIFEGLVWDETSFAYPTIPLIGPGVREDHNCLWDCNLYGKGNYKDVVENFEHVTSSQVLGVWGQVQDHCIAGLVEFYATPTHGRCIAQGLAAYEWNQNDTENVYQSNIEKLTSNILKYLSQPQ